MLPDISFVIPAYNAAGFLEDAVRSAATQTIQNVEIIIIDDASSDETAALGERLAHADPRVKLVRSSTNRGPAAARNYGMELAQGTWIAVLDADDQISPKRSEVLLNIVSASSADIVADNLRLVDQATRSSSTGLLQSVASGGYLLSISPEVYLRNNCILKNDFQLGYLKPMYKAAFIKQQNLRYDESIRLGEDFDFCLRALLLGARFIVTSEPLYTYQIRSDSLSSKLVQSDVTRLIERSKALRKEANISDPSLLAAFGTYEHFLERALAFCVFVEDMKAARFIDACRVATQSPSILSLVAQNGPVAMRKRLQRMRQRLGFLN